MFPLNSHDQYIDENGKRASLGELFEGSEHDIEALETTVSGHTTAIGNLQTKTSALQNQINTDVYSATSGYTAGDYVIHDNKLYKCNTTCTADTWSHNAEYFTETSVSDELADLSSNLLEKTAGTKKYYIIATNLVVDAESTGTFSVGSSTYTLAEILYYGHGGLRQSVTLPFGGNVNIPLFKSTGEVAVISISSPSDGVVTITNNSTQKLTITQIYGINFNAIS